MSNLAYKVQQRNEQTKKAETKQQVVIKRGGITKGERFLWTTAAMILLTGAILIVSNYATIYNINKSMQSTESEIHVVSKKVSDLSVQVAELSEPARIFKIAKEKLGMTLDNKNVKVLN